ncbi:hypothetical protein RclHR1_02780012 [Rhizophagus clarus]|uniref:Crinkler (CRN) family protein n=1 Tax=Rhizophagus clarus TaxID=94130 RepID=A0A2Z6RGB8_9GLOM|nr:hypothetical protein RclHR1_02780012 [Rhizophagus clarus]GES79139.1 crinkler (CRN) family protein [Rhizophagus clarus]
MTKKRGRPPNTSATSSPTATSSSTVTITETTLFCLVHDKPPSSFFSVTVGNHENINGLRKLIKKENEPYLDNFAHWQLKLWIVDIPFDSPNLGDSSVNIANVLQGREFLPPNKVGDIFTTQPNGNNIHIIVELPTSPAPSKAPSKITEGESSYKWSIDTFNETTQQFANILERQTKKPKASLSTMNQTLLDELLKHLGIRRATSVITVDPTDKNFDGPFRYMSYLRDNITIPSTLVWYDPKFKRDLLNINDISFPYSISGTADVLIMDESYYNVLDYRSGIRAVFELKKMVQDQDTSQAISELIATNILSNYAVFAVLTDLNDTWIFYWLSNDRAVMMFRAINSSNALDIIEKAVNEDSTSTATTTTIDPNFPIGTRINHFHHLGNLQEGASENEMESLDLFFNRPKVQFEFEDDVANMKDMFDKMTESEIKDWKMRRALKLLDETPGFQLDKNYMSMYL